MFFFDAIAGAKLSFEATLYYKEINGSWAMMAQSLQEWDLYCQKDSLVSC